MMSKLSFQDHLSQARFGIPRTTRNDGLVHIPTHQHLNPTHQYVISTAGRDLQKAKS